MNILMYEHVGFTGLSFYTLKLSEYIADLGCKVYLLTTKDSILRSNKVEIIRELLPMKTTSKTYMKFIKWLINRLYISIYNAKKRREICELISPDILHLQLTVPLVDQYYLKSLTKRLLTVMTVHDVRRHKKYDVNNLKIILEKIYKFPHALIVHTESNRKQLINEFKIENARISIIPHGIENDSNESSKDFIDRQIWNSNGNGPILLFIGKIRPNKGLDLVLTAMPEIIEKYPEVMLHVAGSMPVGEEFEPYMKLIDEFKLRKHVDVRLKWIDERELSEYYEQSDIVVLPYKKFSSQSGVLMDAYKYEKPVVVTDVGSLGETVTEDGTGIVVHADKKSIAQGIKDLIENRNKYENAVLNMRRCVREKYSWKIVAEKTLHLYKDLIERNAVSRITV